MNEHELTIHDDPSWPNCYAHCSCENWRTETARVGDYRAALTARHQEHRALVGADENRLL